MKKILAIILTLTMACMLLTGCGTKSNDKVGDNYKGTGSKNDTTSEGSDTSKSEDGKYEIAMITDKGNIDDKSFNQGTWEGVKKFAEENKISHQYIKPEEASDVGYLKAIDNAVAAGAKVVVTPGYLFEVPVFTAQTKYPEVKFIILDGQPHTADYKTYKTESNVACVLYNEEQSGYLAGYAAVKDGFTKLGFMGGMAVPAVQAYGYGYLQGANAAATDMNLADAAVHCIYHYTGDFAETDTNKAAAKTMYQEGTEVIFACGGSVGKSVMSAAKEANAKVIGVDVDQRYDSDTVITSAMKGLGASVITVLESIYKTNKWTDYAGKTTYFNASNNGVGLPTVVIGDEKGNAFDRFKTFDKAAYDEVYKTLSDGTAKPIREIKIKDKSGVATADELVSGLNLKKVTIETR